MRLIFVALLFIVTGCNRSIDESVLDDLPPSPFKVYVDERGANHAIIHWDPETFADPSSITYSIELNGDTIVSGLDTTGYRLTNLNTKSYTGSVTAHGPNNTSFSAPFQLKAIEAFGYFYTSTGMSKGSMDSTYVPAWSFDVGNNTDLAGFPITSGDTLFFASQNHLFAINKKTGTEYWRIAVRSVGYSFVYTPGKAYMLIWNGSNLQLGALNTNTKEFEWKVDLDTSPGPNSGPALANNTLYFCGYSLWAIDLNGNVKWTVSSPGGMTSPYVYAGSKNVYFTDYRGINAVNAATGQIIWSKPRFNVEVDYAFEYRGIVYPLIHEHLYALDSETGSTVWDYSPSATTVTAAGPVTRGDTIYMGVAKFPNLQNAVMAFHYKTGQLFWSTDLPSPYDVPPNIRHMNIAGNSIYVDGKAEIDAQTGTLRRRLFPGGVFSGAMEVDGKDYLSNSRHGFGIF